MMCARVVLPRPGGPKSSTWSSASARLRAAWMKISSCPRTLSWPTYSASVAGRRERSICSSCVEVGFPEMSRSVSTATRAFCQRKKKGRDGPGLCPRLPGALELVLHPDREDVDFGVVEALPLRADPEVPRQIVGSADPKEDVGTGASAAGRDAGTRGARFVIRAGNPALAEDLELLAHRPDSESGGADALELALGAHCTHPWYGRRNRDLAQVRVEDFSGEIAVDAVAAKNLPGSVLLIATEAARASALSLHLPEAGAGIPAGLGLRLCKNGH